jgi:plastocyanin
LILAGCSSKSDTEPAKATTTLGPLDAGAAGDCPMRMPGELVAEAEAVVKFDVDRVCPGYLTVAPGTTVRLRNESSDPAQVTVEFGEQSPGTPLLDETVDPGDETSIELNDAGFYRYRTSTIPSFVGTFEVPSG